MRMRFDDWYRERPLIFAHRGASAYAPMNTLPAFELAAEQGADGIELDVWLCGDRQSLVILHDATVDHTTDGSGRVYDMTLAELKELDASHTFDQYRGVKIPTLDEVFEAVGKRVLINVEIKAEPGMLPAEQAVAGKIVYFGLQERVIVSSFSAHVLRRFRDVMPQVAIAFLHDADTPPTEWDVLGGMQYEARHPNHQQVEAAYMEAAKRDGFRVNTWTVNDALRAAVLRDLGVDAIITDVPDVMLAVVGA